jgi:polyribonucleotide nucleotidyltransferase
MHFNIVTQIVRLPDGREISIETGKLARQADGAVVVRLGNTMILATVVSAQEAKEDLDFLPLSVDYQEKFASSGKIPGGFLKREGKLSDHEVLVSRLVDRALRPLFPDDYHAETQVNLALISHDPECPPDALVGLAASSALAVSDIPFPETVSEVRVIKHKDGRYIVNPSPALIAESVLDLIVAATYRNIMMVEGESKEVSEEEMLEALRVAHEAIKIQCLAQDELAEKVGKTKRTYCHEKVDEELKKRMYEELYPKAYAAARQLNSNKNARSEAFSKIKEEFVASLPEDHTYDKFLISQYFHQIKKKASRDLCLNESLRLDGRALTEIRPIACEVDYLPSAHGSAIFTRGETQSLTTVTLGTKLDEQMIDGATVSGTSKFILHYNFPGFSTGEVKPNRGPGRREVGHGNLAMRALKQVLPDESQNPYTIRVVSDILESNGSSSMATVCAGTLALMDAGIKIKAPVSGIAMGMISDSETGKYAILSDILGDEDHLGDMDFKVTGTENGITACQMDIKVDGLSYDVLRQALEQAKAGRLHILREMQKAITQPKESLKPHAPRIVTLYIERDTIGGLIGPGGKNIQEIQRTTGTTVVIEEKDNRGVVNIFAVNQSALDAAVKLVKASVAQPEIGEVYTGIVKTIQPFGAFVEFLKGKDGLLHISEITWERLDSMDGVLNEGDEIQVKLVDIENGKFRLSRKALLPRPEHIPEPKPRPSNPSSGNGQRNGGNRGGGGNFKRR